MWTTVKSTHTHNDDAIISKKKLWLIKLIQQVCHSSQLWLQWLTEVNHFYSKSLKSNSLLQSFLEKERDTLTLMAFIWPLQIAVWVFKAHPLTWHL